MKTPSQLDALKTIRKNPTPPTRVIRPKKGGGYRRKGKYSPFQDTMEYHQSFA